MTTREISIRRGFGAGVLVLGLAALADAQFRVAPLLPIPGEAPGTSAAAGDFNGDGLQDIAISYANEFGTGVAVFLRTGPTTFAPPLFQTGVQAVWRQVAAADLNGDGLTDLVQTNGNILTRLMADGTGGFVEFTMNDIVFWDGVAVADLNGDGHPDVVAGFFDITGSTQFFLGVSFGDGVGGFSAVSYVHVAQVVKSGQITVGDFNGDGDVDVAITDRVSGALGSVVVVLNDGNGNFTFASKTTTGSNARSIATADLDGDGKLDLAVGNNSDDTLSILKGNGSGGFAVTATLPAPLQPGWVVAEDLDGDGKRDLVVAGDGIAFYRGDGSGGFAEPERYAATGGLWLLDIDSDGRLDIEAGSAQVLNLGNGAFAAPRQFQAGTEIAGMAVGDFNGDGKKDILTANRASNDLALLLGNGDGTFAPPRLFPTATGPDSLAVADFNGDGRLDAAEANESATASVYLGDGAGNLAQGALLITGDEPRGVAAADVNADGTQDLAVVNLGLGGNGAVLVFLGNGTGAFTPGAQYPLVGTGSAVVACPVNPDPRPDLIVATNLTTLLGNGAGGFIPQVQTPLSPAYGLLAVGDLNGDGRLDVATPGIYLGDGYGGFTHVPIPPLDERFGPVAVADFTRDGAPDLAFPAIGTRGVNLGVGDGSGAFGRVSRAYMTGGQVGALAQADFNGDGYPDLAVGERLGDSVTILLNEPAAPGADLSLEVTHSPDPATYQQPLTFTLTVQNNGPLTATGVRLTFKMAGGISFSSSTPGPPTCQVELPMFDPPILHCSFADLPPGASQVVSVFMTVTQQFSELTFRAIVAADAPLDLHPADNDATQVVPIGPSPDLAISMTDSLDPVAPGAPFSYVIDVSNVGAGPSSAGAVVEDALPSLVTYVSSNPPGACTQLTTLQCNVPPLAPGANAQLMINVLAGTFTSVHNVVTVSNVFETEFNLSNNTAAEDTRGDLGILRELVHGAALTEAFPSGTPAERLYYVQQQAHASYEVVVDATSGDVAGTGQTVSLQRLDVALLPIQDAEAAGAGQSRTLHWENASDQAVDAEVVRVRSTGCSTGCGPGDAYRIRAYETTAQIARFNTSGTQTTVLVFENRTTLPVQGHAWLWDEDGLLVGSVPFSLGGHQTMTSNLATVAPGRRGAVTVSHDGGYGALDGKAVALEPATGFTFDTPLVHRPR